MSKLERFAVSTSLFIFGAVAPLFLFYVSSALFSPWERSGHTSLEMLFDAKIVMVPLAIFAAAAFVAVKVVRVKQYRTWHAIGLWSGVTVCSWTIIAACLTFASNFQENFVLFFFMFLFSFVFLIVYYTIALEVSRAMHHDEQNDMFIAFIASLPFVAAAVIYANKLYSELPEHYDCYVVSASQYANPSIVRYVQLSSGNRVSRQLLIYKAFEFLLKNKFPKQHNTVRRIYDRFGPPVARFIAKKQYRATFFYKPA